MRPFVVNTDRAYKVRHDAEREWIPNLREAWAEACNEQLLKVGASVFLDPRRTEVMAADAGIDPMWLPRGQGKLPPAAAALDRRGVATVEGMRAGVTAIQAVHKRVDRSAASAAAGADAVAESLLNHLDDDQVAHAHARWQAAHSTFVESRRAAAMLRYHAETAIRPVVKAGIHWGFADLLQGRVPTRGPLSFDREPTARNQSTNRVSAILRKPEETERILRAISVATPGAFAAREALTADADAADRQAIAAAASARKAWADLAAVLPPAAIDKSVQFYRRAARDEFEITHSGRMMRELDRLLAKGAVPNQRDVSRIGFEGHQHSAARLAAVRRRQARIQAVLAGRAARDFRCATELAVAHAQKQGFDLVRAPAGLSALTRREWPRLANCEALRKVAAQALEMRVDDLDGLNVKQRSVVVEYAVEQTRRERGAALMRTIQKVSALPRHEWPADLKPIERAGIELKLKFDEEIRTYGSMRKPKRGEGDYYLSRDIAALERRARENKRRDAIAAERAAAERKRVQEEQRALVRQHRRAEWLSILPREQWGEVTERERQMALFLIKLRKGPKTQITLGAKCPRLRMELSAHIARQRAARERARVADVANQAPAPTIEAAEAPAPKRFGPTYPLPEPFFLPVRDVLMTLEPRPAPKPLPPIRPAVEPAPAPIAAESAPSAMPATQQASPASLAVPVRQPEPAVARAPEPKPTDDGAYVEIRRATPAPIAAPDQELAPVELRPSSPAQAPTRRSVFDERYKAEVARIRPALPEGEFAWPEARRIGLTLLRLDRRARRLQQLGRRLSREPGRMDLGVEVAARRTAAEEMLEQLGKAAAKWAAGVPELADWTTDRSAPGYDAYRLASAAGAPDEDRRKLALIWASRPDEMAHPNRVPPHRREEIAAAIREAAPEYAFRLEPRRDLQLSRDRDRSLGY